MGIVVTNVKFHSNQGKTSQSTVTNVFQSINHKDEKAQVVEDLAVEVVEDLAVEVVLAVEVDLTEDHEKCTRLHVEIVAKIVKYHSSQNKTNQYTAMIVFKIINQQEIRKRLYYDSKFY